MNFTLMNRIYSTMNVTLFNLKIRYPKLRIKCHVLDFMEYKLSFLLQKFTRRMYSHVPNFVEFLCVPIYLVERENRYKETFYKKAVTF